MSNERSRGEDPALPFSWNRFGQPKKRVWVKLRADEVVLTRERGRESKIRMRSERRRRKDDTWTSTKLHLPNEHQKEGLRSRRWAIKTFYHGRPTGDPSYGRRTRSLPSGGSTCTLQVPAKCVACLSLFPASAFTGRGCTLGDLGLHL